MNFHCTLRKCQISTERQKLNRLINCGSVFFQRTSAFLQVQLEFELLRRPEFGTSIDNEQEHFCNTEFCGCNPTKDTISSLM